MVEGTQEIPKSIQTEQPLDKKLKKDSADQIPFDKPRDFLRLFPFSGIPLAVAGATGLDLWLDPQASNLIAQLSRDIFIGSGSVLAARGIKDLITETINLRKARKIEQEHSVVDPEIGYRADRCVYQGKKPIKIGEEAMRKGDNFYFIQLPQISGTESPELLDVKLDAYNYSLKDIKEGIKDKNYQFVAIDTDPISQVQQPFASTLEASRKEIFAGKQQRAMRKEDRRCLVFTREEFEDFTVSPHDLFNKLLHALNDTKLFHLAYLARQAKIEDEKLRAQDLFKQRLDRVLFHEVETRFNGPEIERRLGTSLIPERKKVYLRSLMQQTQTGLVFVRVNDENGEVHSTPLETLLHIKEQSFEEILDSKSSIKKAQVAYIIHRMIFENNLEDLIKKPVKSRDEIVRELNKHKEGIQSPHKSVSQLVERGVLPPGVFKKIRFAMAPLILYSLIQQAIQTAENVDWSKLSVPGVVESVANSVLSKDEKQKLYELHFQDKIIRGELGFHDTLPAAHSDWWIRGDGMSTDGYYITGTSHVFENKRWKENQEASKILDLPKHLINERDSNKPPHLLLETMRRHLRKGQAIKIPIRDNTKVSAIDISIIMVRGQIEVTPPPELQNKLQFQTEELTDGSLQIRIQSVPDETDIVGFWISYNLLRTDQNNIHATEHLKPIDIKKLSKKAKEDLLLTNGVPTESSTFFKAVKLFHEYSLDPPGKEKLDHARTPEEVVNAIMDIPGCFCETCNSAAVLASSIATESPPVNMAYGYIALGNHPAGASAKQGVLRSDARHAFAVGANGEILDATPSNIASDDLTREYIRRLHFSEDEFFSQTNRLGKDYDADSSKQPNSNELKLKILAAVLASTTGVLGAYQIARLLKRLGTKENISSLSDDIITKILSKDDLRKAYEFFSWLSYGKTDSEFRQSSQPVDFSNGDEALEKIRNNINYEKLVQYVERPKAFERLAERKKGIEAKANALKLRLLARYLIR